MKRFIISILFIHVLTSLSAFKQIDTLLVHSTSMNKFIKAVVILPKNYRKNKQYPVTYILHGFSDNYAKWVKTAPEIIELSSKYQTIVICPDGGYSSWYFDSPIDSTYKYETFITKELVPFIDSKYKTIANRNARAITGHSMGGHGALYITLRHLDIFANVGSMSGGVNLLTSTGKYDISKRIGDLKNNRMEWENRSIINMVNSLKNRELNIIIDCGVDDFFYDDNVEIHKRLLQNKIEHYYFEFPGQHDWNYWRKAIRYQFLFFSEQFKFNK